MSLNSWPGGDNFNLTGQFRLYYTKLLIVGQLLKIVKNNMKIVHSATESQGIQKRYSLCCRLSGPFSYKILLEVPFTY